MDATVESLNLRTAKTVVFPQTELASVGVLAVLIEGPVVITHHRGASESSKLL